jgi:CheY-like chemotaxis protein
MQYHKPILLVEDDNIDAMTVKRALKDLGAANDLVHLNNGEEALEYLKDENNKKPCIILLDLNMPKMNGVEFLNIIKADEQLKQMPVIVLTTSRKQCDILDTFELSVAGYLVKPVDYEEFVKAISTIKRYWILSELPDKKMGVRDANFRANFVG